MKLWTGAHQAQRGAVVRYQRGRSPDRLKAEIPSTPFHCCPCRRFLLEAYILQQKMGEFFPGKTDQADRKELELWKVWYSFH